MTQKSLLCRSGGDHIMFEKLSGYISYHLDAIRNSFYHPEQVSPSHPVGELPDGIFLHWKRFLDCRGKLNKDGD